MVPPPLHLSDIRCKCFPCRRSRGKQITLLKGAMNERTKVSVSAVEILFNCLMTEIWNCFKICNILCEICKRNLKINVILRPRSHLPRTVKFVNYFARRQRLFFVAATWPADAILTPLTSLRPTVSSKCTRNYLATGLRPDPLRGRGLQRSQTTSWI